ncbi:hypothetical protein HWC75_gp005 [Salmonella phage 1-19]|uniref:Uncharacterized protein n=2 Tax=Epseptimavirus TaxID=2732017 RepID=A0A410T6V0_9CAUD|nr:hypothetical protein HOV02_gp082 [Salmonella phage 3-29]YP_009853093.1 hypothetical protein HWC75_gp005 [Salmonella phage 1-19]QAU04692.1 hypothetical protein [Salmonella phage 3-29]QFR58024.1 hypothetical protein [Salmonella phage 1-19]
MYNMKTQNAKCKMQEVRFAPSQKKKKKINKIKELVKQLLTK